MQNVHYTIKSVMIDPERFLMHYCDGQVSSAPETDDSKNLEMELAWERG